MACRLLQGPVVPSSIATASRDAFVVLVTLEVVEMIGNSKEANAKVQVAGHWLFKQSCGHKMAAALVE